MACDQKLALTMVVDHRLFQRGRDMQVNKMALRDDGWPKAALYVLDVGIRFSI